MKRVFLLLSIPILVCLITPGAFCADANNLPESAKVSERIFNLKGLSNVGKVSKGIFRGAQPEASGYATLKSMGIKTVLNLRNKHSDKKMVEAAGMKSMELKFDILKGTPDKAVVESAIKALKNPENHPVYVHCAHGQDRTGVVIAIYRIEVEGWPYDAAIDEMQAFGFNDIWTHLKEFLRQYETKRAKM